MPQAHYLGLTLPMPISSFIEETGHWEYGTIDWDGSSR